MKDFLFLYPNTVFACDPKKHTDYDNLQAEKQKICIFFGGTI